MNPTEQDRRVTIDLTDDADADIEAAVAALMAERPGCQIMPKRDSDEECGDPAVVARLRRFNCGHEEHLAWRYACAAHAPKSLICWHCGTPIDIVIELPIGGAS